MSGICSSSEIVDTEGTSGTNLVFDLHLKQSDGIIVSNIEAINRPNRFIERGDYKDEVCMAM